MRYSFYGILLLSIRVNLGLSQELEIYKDEDTTKEYSDFDQRFVPNRLAIKESAYEWYNNNFLDHCIGNSITEKPLSENSCLSDD